jgi:hypothetical protein
VAVHGSVSLMVNFHALKAVAAAYGAQGAWRGAQQHGWGASCRLG